MLSLARMSNITKTLTRNISNLTQKMRNDAKEIYDSAVDSVIPDKAIYNHMKIEENKLIFGPTDNQKQFNLKDIGQIYVFGAGKASIPMASACEEILGDKISYGHIITKKGAKNTRNFKYINVTYGGHPVPDEDGVKGTHTFIDYLTKTNENDLVIFLMSGGASALMAAPTSGLSLTDLQITTNELLSCGATIHDINTIRKHISSIKGGNFARLAYPSHLVTLILSDVVGDTLNVIGSGPTVPDTATFQDCVNIINKYNKIRPMNIPFSVYNYLETGLNDPLLETPKIGDKIFEKTTNYLVANNYLALCAAKNKALDLGYNPLILSSSVEGEAKEVGKVLVSLAKEVHATGNPIQKPACLLCGGETTVTINGKGKGGRNQEMALSALESMEGLRDTTILCGGTDGGDGPTDAAGGVVDADLYDEAKSKGLNITDYIRRNDSYTFFSSFSDNHLKPGQTGTNVMDINILLMK